MKNPFVASALLLIFLAGCATRPPAPKSKYVSVDPVLGQVLQDRGTHLLVKPTPSFRRITRGDHAKLSTAMMFGAIGGGVGAAIVFSQAESAGQAIVTKNGIPDPTLRMSERVRELLRTRYDNTTSESGLAVTVSTDYWSLAMNDLVFSASITIEDAAKDSAKREKPLAKGTCGYRSAPDGPTADALLENEAAQLKAELDAALEYCVQEFHQKLFL